MNLDSNKSWLLCSECFADHGLMLNAFQLGSNVESQCRNCGKTTGRKLCKEKIAQLSHQFFVRGTLHRSDYGGAPVIQFNEHQNTSVTFDTNLKADVKLIESAIGVGFFHYGPRLWMIGEVEPLKDLQDPKNRGHIIERIFQKYPIRSLYPGDLFYRLRINPKSTLDEVTFDSPPDEYLGRGRLDSSRVPILYASQDLEVCIHECRATVDDEIYVATLTPKQELRILDLTELIKEDTTEFESLDMAIHMLFLAGEHSYKISQELAVEAAENNLDGIVYPSYFSTIRTGAMPFETAYGLSVRRLHSFSERVRRQTIRNLGIFGRPISTGKVEVKCTNRMVIKHVAYDFSFGPIEY